MLERVQDGGAEAAIAFATIVAGSEDISNGIVAACARGCTASRMLNTLARCGLAEVNTSAAGLELHAYQGDADLTSLLEDVLEVAQSALIVPVVAAQGVVPLADSILVQLENTASSQAHGGASLAALLAGVGSEAESTAAAQKRLTATSQWLKQVASDTSQVGYLGLQPMRRIGHRCSMTLQPSAEFGA